MSDASKKLSNYHDPAPQEERTTGLRRGHLADLEVIEAILRSDPREEASEYAANPRAMADAVRNMIEDPDLHNPESVARARRANTTPERVERWTVYQPDYRCPHCGSDDIGPVLVSEAEPAAYWCPSCAREIPEAPQVEVIPVAPLLRWLDEQIESEREWGGIAGNVCANAYEDVKDHIEGRDADA